MSAAMCYGSHVGSEKTQIPMRSLQFAYNYLYITCAAFQGSVKTLVYTSDFTVCCHSVWQCTFKLISGKQCRSPTITLHGYRHRTKKCTYGILLFMFKWMWGYWEVISVLSHCPVVHYLHCLICDIFLLAALLPILW